MRGEKSPAFQEIWQSIKFREAFGVRAYSDALNILFEHAVVKEKKKKAAEYARTQTLREFDCGYGCLVALSQPDSEISTPFRPFCSC